MEAHWPVSFWTYAFGAYQIFVTMKGTPAFTSAVTSVRRCSVPITRLQLASAWLVARPFNEFARGFSFIPTR